jgi:hypothetical protein
MQVFIQKQNTENFLEKIMIDQMIQMYSKNTFEHDMKKDLHFGKKHLKIQI